MRQVAHHPLSLNTASRVLGIPIVGRTVIGQTFRALRSALLRSCLFEIDKVGSPTGTLTARLWNATGILGDGAVPVGLTPDQNVLAESEARDAATGVTSGRLIVQFRFQTPYQLVAGSDYAIGVYYAGGDLSNHLRVWRTSGTLHVGNRFEYDLGAWVGLLLAGEDIGFEVLGDVARPRRYIVIGGRT